MAAFAVGACGGDDFSGNPNDGGVTPDSTTVTPDGTTVTPDGPVVQTDGGPPPRSCGNGSLDVGEECDGTNHNNVTCQTLGFSGGQLTCTTQCKLDSSGCTGTPPTGKQFGQKWTGNCDCAEGLVCLLANEAGKNEGYCSKKCSDTAPCPASPAGAQCMWQLSQDPTDTACGFACDPQSPACPPGLACTLSADGYHYCSTDAPAICGDNKVDAINSEECDGAQLNNLSCQAIGFTGGTLKCDGQCKYDKSGCTGQSSCANLPPLECTAGNAACSKLEQFAPTPGDGYIVYHPAAWSWLRRDTTMLVKYAAAAVKCLMPGGYPLATYDMSMQNGGTPEQNGQLRHPQNTHDYGRDIDMSYYITGQGNNLATPCAHTSGGIDQYHCVSAPTILDVPRSTLFLMKLLEGSRVRVIGVDGQIGPLVKAEAQKLLQQGLIATTTYNKINKIAFETTDGGAGWYLFHHNHTHLSTVTTGYPTPMLPEPDAPWVEPAPADPTLPLFKVLPIACEGGGCSATMLRQLQAPSLDLSLAHEPIARPMARCLERRE